MTGPVPVNGADADLVRLEIRTPAPEADLALLRELGWREPPAATPAAPTAAGGAGQEGAVAVLRSCADPYGVEVRLVRGEGPGRLQWRPHRAAATDEVRQRLRAHPFGRWEQELRWEVDRPWVGGHALRCPLHAEDSTQLCEAEPPLLERLALAPEAPGDEAAGQDDEVVVLTVRTPLAREDRRVVRAPGGWAVELLPPQRRPSDG